MKEMRREKRRTVPKKIITMVIAVVLLVNMPAMPVNADSAAHEHDANCYVGTIHAAHTSACYTNVSTQEYCSGTYRFDGYIYETVSERWKYFYCANRKCGYYYDGDKIGNAVESCRYYVSEHGTWYDSGYVSSVRCPDCGKRCSSTTRTEDSYSARIDRVRCSSCGAVEYDGPYPNVTPRKLYTVHGYHTVTRQQLTCKKELGVYYDENGNKAGCVCDRIVSRAIAEEETQTLRPGEPINTNGIALLYNGQVVEVTAAKRDVDCFLTGSHVNVDNSTIEEYTVKIDETKYPYHIDDKTGKRENGSASYKITVYRKEPEYEIIAETGEGGSLGSFAADDGVEKKSFSEGKEVMIVASPYSGWMVDHLKIDGEKIRGSSFGDMVQRFIMPGRNVKVEAVFRRKECEIAFDPNGGNWGGKIVPVIRSGTYGATYLATKTFPWDPNKSGCVFAGWFDSSGNRVEVTDICTVDEKLTLYAKWQDAMEKTKLFEFEDHPEHELPVDINGFEFDESSFWRKEERNGNGYGEAAAQNDLIRKTDDMILYGHWEPKEFELHFDPNGGSLAEDERSKTVLYHTLIGELPAPVKEGALFEGWFTDRIEGEKMTANSPLTVATDLVLYARWSGDDGKNAVIDAGIYAINNDERMDRNEDGIVICEAGDRVSFRLWGVLPTEASIPLRVSVKPRYFLLESEPSEEVHILSTGWQGNRIVTFYERGKDFDDSLSFDPVDKEFRAEFHWVLPHLSYAVKNEDYDKMLAYSEISTLSGKEDFFTRPCTLLVRFDVSITDGDGREFCREGAEEVMVELR
ncbi:MAG: InlB B-repeat-containing protein [Lachnospiraceae bacterium]|nr:InlB B-repeat-containing protein [Lachnospiraceae bacterium]